ncbi:MAG: BON domain-containing protein [Acidobacteria bacterium]|jgi:hyperosmotically inducible protein|nr:BON domain-containing protein [Acidobacteriota bacterium]
MRRLTILTFVAVAAMALIGCPAATNTTTNVKTNSMNANSNVAVVVNNNSAVVMNSNMGMSSNRYSTNMTREEYDKNKADYEKDRTGSTIGQGANDSWLWFKTKSALATTNDLRDSTINVDVVNDVITLKGTVATKAESDKALSVARGIDGQKGVKNELKVQPNDSMGNQMTSGNTNKMTNSNMKK